MTMDLTLSQEQLELRSTVRMFLDRYSPEAEVRRLMGTDEGYEPAVWQLMADQLGLQGMAIPENYGGMGFGFRELAIVCGEMGRTLLGGPFFPTLILAANVLLVSQDEAAKLDYLPDIASGALTGTLALTEADGRIGESAVEVTAQHAAEAWTVTGTKCHVIEGHSAELIFVTARTAAGVSIFAVRGDDAGVRRSLLPTLDATRKLATIEFSAAAARLIGADGDGWSTVERVLDLGCVALAAEQVGAAQAMLDMSVQYAKDRVQFGRPIGSFQAIKHKCADLLLEVESARSLAEYAAACADEPGRAELPVSAAMAKSVCSQAFFHVAVESIEIHGGMGFTWEHPAHLYFKRAKSSEVLLGTPTFWREVLATRIGFDVDDALADA